MPAINTSILTKQEMLSVVDNDMPNQYYAICSDDGFIYKYDKSNTASVETGKFAKYTSTGSRAVIDVANLIMNNYSNPETIVYDNRELNDLVDVNVSTPSNGQVLKYDATNNIWINGSAPGGGGGTSSTVLTQTLTAGSTSVTFTNIPTSGNYLIDFYTSTGINYTAIDTATAGQVTLSFEEQAANVAVYCELKEITE